MVESVLKHTAITFLAITGFSVVMILASSAKTSALSGGDFNAGRIIDDVVFYNSSTMNSAQIQQFLNSKVSVCDTSGSQPYAGTTRAAYGTSRGYPPPYICLKDYSMVVPTITNSGSDLCKGSVAGGTKTAAQIIFDVGQACGINPQVLLVLLQKEQSLVSDDWPWSIQYRSATGYGCPDTAPCDSEYYGFFNQVYQAAKAYRRYEANPTWYNYRAGRNNFIYYHPSLGACGGTNVFIQNQATANLYIYTPYQPNAAALNNLYGTGDGCSAYGNRNFWRMFNDWFGSTQRVNAEISLSKSITTSDVAPREDQLLEFSYTVINSGAYSVDSGILWVCGDLNGVPFGGGSNRKVLSPGETLTMSMTYRPRASGVLKIRACGDIPNGAGYTEGYPYAESGYIRERWDLVNNNPIKVSGHVISSLSSPKVGETTSISYEVINLDTQEFDTGVLWVCGDLNGVPFGGGSNRAILAPGSRLKLSLNYTPIQKGKLTARVCGDIPNGTGYSAKHPYADYSDHKVRTYQVTDTAIKISWAVHHTSNQMIIGQSTTLRYAITNTSTSQTMDSGILWICGDLNGVPFGGGSNRKVLSPGETLTMSMAYTPTQKGLFRIRACGNLPNGPGYVEGYPYRDYIDHGERTYFVN